MEACNPLTRQTLYSAGFCVDSLGEGGWVALKEGFVPDADLFDALRKTLPLRAETLRIWGREVPMPRLTSFHGDPGRTYHYSGRTFEPSPMTPELAGLRDALTRVTGHAFNAVVANLYRDGKDSIGWHADDEPELGPAPDNVLIASISLGSARRFLIRHNRTRLTQEYPLGGGSLLLMGGTMQRFWQHSIPRTTKPAGPRLNLTFRVVGLYPGGGSIVRRA